MRRAREFFTLIELLVVIAVISVLASLMLPAISSAKKTVKRIACASNEKQLGTAAMLYVNDYDSWMPSAYTPSSMNIDLWPYAHYAPDVLVYPSIPTWKTPKGPFFCPATEPFGQDPAYTGTYAGTPATTSYATFCGNKDYGAWMYWDAALGPLRKRLTQISPGAAILVDGHLYRDTGTILSTSQNTVWPSAITATAYVNSNSAAWRHQSLTANVLFIDAHVKSFKYAYNKTLFNNNAQDVGAQ